MEYTDLDKREPRDKRYRGALSIRPYRRWLLRKLEEAAAAGRDDEARAIKAKLERGGMTL